MNPRDLADLKLLAWVIAFSVSIGAVYGGATNEFTLTNLLRGGLTGALIGGTLTSIELFYSQRPGGRWLAKRPFAIFVLIKSLVFALIIVVLIYGPDLLFEGRQSVIYIPDLLRDLAFSLSVSFGIILFVEIDRLLGGGVLLRFILGRYHRPRVERRIFLFADLIGSTALAERIGDLAFHAMLDQLFFDLADPIVRHRGEIYRYVGDEVIVTWREAEGLEAGRCLACAVAIQETLGRLAPRYRDRYGVEPRMRQVLHTGPVVTGEMGDLKREIVFLGDTVNTTARIEAAAKAAGRDLVVSGPLLERLALPAGLAAEPLDAVELKGKAQPVSLYGLVGED